MNRQPLARLGALVALGVAVAAVVVLLFGSGSSYVIHAQFEDAGQLVNGDLVTVAGHQVGSVGGIRLTGNGLAEVELDISDSSITPLRTGTIATVGQLSLTGVANRFVGLSLGAGSPIRSGGALPPEQTRGIVDLDVLLDSLTPRVRTSLQQIIKTGAYVVSAPTPKQANESFRYLNPAFGQLTQLGREIVADKFALERLVASTADVSSALAARSGDLGGAITNTASALRLIASQRSALQGVISRSPAVLAQGTRVLGHVNSTLTVLNPALRDLQPVAPRLAKLLTKLVPAAADAIPTINGVEALVPSARQALVALPPIERKATPSVKSLTTALRPLVPILAGFRPYVPDLVAGFFNSLGGANGESYDANGHYARIMPVLAGTGAGLTGVLSLLGPLTGSLAPLNGQRTGMLARCPGGGAAPATNGGNPWTSPDFLPATVKITGTLCNPAHDQR
jgi:phospholipid/cholesterol/gamma-HCH transport system substrate-binding protein